MSLRIRCTIYFMIREHGLSFYISSFYWGMAGCWASFSYDSWCSSKQVVHCCMQAWTILSAPWEGKGKDRLVKNERVELASKTKKSFSPSAINKSLLSGLMLPVFGLHLGSAKPSISTVQMVHWWICMHWIIISIKDERWIKMLPGLTSSCVTCGSPIWKPPFVNMLYLFLGKDSSLRGRRAQSEIPCLVAGGRNFHICHLLMPLTYVCGFERPHAFAFLL